jgi:hypothetical protein
MNVNKLKKEAARLQAGRKRRVIRVEIGGEALDAWDTLIEAGARKGIGPAEVMALLLIRGGVPVARTIGELPDLKKPTTNAVTP